MQCQMLNQLLLLSFYLFTTAQSQRTSSSFVPICRCQSHSRLPTKLCNVPSKCDRFLYDLYEKALTFRIVVIGDGAIMESTHTLGNPHMIMQSSLSPKSGEPVVTFASPDKSFEFHVKINEIETVQFAERQNMKICRLLKSNSASVCSLILKDESREASTWFADMKRKYESSS